MKDTEYTFAVARIRSNENRLISAQDLESVINAPSYEDAVAKLNSCGYEIKGTDYTPALNKRLNDAWQLVYEVLPDKSELDSLIIANDFANLKIALKSMVTGEQASHLYETPSVWDSAEIEKNCRARSNSRLPEPLQHADRSAYSILTKTGYAQLGDAVIDRAALEWAIKLSEKSDNSYVPAIAQMNAATADIRILYRCIKAGKARSFMERSVCACEAFDKKDIITAAEMGLDRFFEFLSHTDYSGAAAALKESTVAFEKYCDDMKIKLLRGAKTETFGIAPVIAYYYAAEAEVKNARIILSAKMNSVSADAIKARVRELYV